MDVKVAGTNFYDYVSGCTAVVIEGSSHEPELISA